MKKSIGDFTLKTRPVRAGFRLAVLFCSLLAASAQADWTALSTFPPNSVNIELMLLLPDGTIMAAHNFGGGYGNDWYKLTPNNLGHYTNGVWSTRASASYTRLWCSSQVLNNRKVFVAGGEYGTGTTNVELYDIGSDTWSKINPPLSLFNPGAGDKFVDSGSKVLPNGNILVAPVTPLNPNGTLIYNPYANSWSAGPTNIVTQDEATWVKLPDGSIITVDHDSTTSERYLPSLNIWTNDANLPVNLWATLSGYIGETGPAFLLPDGRAFFIGGSGHTAYYTPSGSNAQGHWTQGPDIPGGLAAADAPGVMMANGKILCAAASAPYIDGSGNAQFPNGVSFFEFDYTAGINGQFVSVSAPSGFSTDGISSYQALMLALPDGNVLYSHFGNDLYVYHPNGPALVAGKPSISSVAFNSGGTITLSGTQFNGISEGASYGDDAQMGTDYPMVRFTDGSGNISYGYTYNWSSTSVQTGGRLVSTGCSLPPVVANGPGAYSMQVVANGIASDPVSIQGPVWVDFNFFSSPYLGTYNNPYVFFSDGVNAVAPGGTIFIKAGTTPQNMPTPINKAMTIVAVGGDVTIGH